jgi:RNA polymerase sigma factor (sigma-70 family)
VDATSLSLLERLRIQSDQDSWRQLVSLYTPLIRSTLARFRVPHIDTEDLAQEVLAVLVREIRSFEHNGRRGAFRSWLRTIVVFRLQGYWRTKKALSIFENDDVEAQLAELEDSTSDPARQWDEEHNAWIARRLMEMLEPDFAPSTWIAFRRQVLENANPADVARELGLSVNAVLIAKSRVLQRLREEGRGLVD